MLSHHLNLAFGQRGTGALSLQRRLSDFSASTRPPTVKITSLAFVSVCRLAWFTRKCLCVIQNLDLNIVGRVRLLYSLREVVTVLLLILLNPIIF